VTDVLLLAIDTSTTAITTALHDGSTVVAEVTTLDARAHAEHLAPGIRHVLADAGATPTDVTDVVVGVGPGPFTGLRVGIVTARTFAHALDLPVRGLTSLDAIAHEAWLAGRRGDLLVATDARRKEVYAATYVLDDGGATRVAGPLVSRAADLEPGVRELPTAGRGALLYADSLPVAAPPLDVSGGALADLAVRRLAVSPAAPDGIRQHVEPGAGFDGLEPLYLRRPDVAPAPPSTKSTLG
jgi:tRNA threonylcarbamoyl adenosine modification protein YeaZ